MESAEACTETTRGTTNLLVGLKLGQLVLIGPDLQDPVIRWKFLWGDRKEQLDV